MTLQQQFSSSTKEEIEIGLNFIICHFDQTILYFPRTIMTRKLGYQKEVYSKEEALQYFQDSNFLDCRINSFRYSSAEQQQQWNSDLIFIDLDRNNFNNDKNFENALSFTLKNIKEKLDGFPTVLKSGNGYHIIQPIEAIAFENFDNDTMLFIKNEFSNDFNLFNEFLRFTKDFLSNGKADKHNNPSFRSCLLRIPGSINSKHDRKVTIVQRYNGYRPTITEEFLEHFVDYLIQKKIDAEQNQRQKMLLKLKERENKEISTNNRNYYNWIDKKILANLFEDYRKIIVNLILASYLIVIKKLSFEESYQIIKEWLQKCNLLSGRKLDFNPRSIVNTALATAYKKQIPPMTLYTLKTNYKDLYFLIEQKI